MAKTPEEMTISDVNDSLNDAMTYLRANNVRNAESHIQEAQKFLLLRMRELRKLAEPTPPAPIAAPEKKLPVPGPVSDTSIYHGPFKPPIAAQTENVQCRAWANLVHTLSESRKAPAEQVDAELDEYEYSPEIRNIYDRCQANVVSFGNDEVSTLLVEIDRLAKGKR